MLEVLGGGLFGAVLVFVLGLVVINSQRTRRIRGNWEALYVEVTECGRIAREYIKSKIAAPLYRLPTICYENCLPSLLSDSGINEDAADALLKFYAEVQTLNRGLDLADSLRHTGDKVLIDAEFGRNCLKANRIEQPSGDLYTEALAMCDRGKSPPK